MWGGIITCISMVISGFSPDLYFQFFSFGVLGGKFQYYNQWPVDPCRGRRGRDHMVVGFTTTYAISAYHHWCCEFESQLGQSVQHYVIKFVSDLQQVGGFLHQENLPTRYSWNIVKSGIKHHQKNKNSWPLTYSGPISMPHLLGHKAKFKGS